MNIKIKCLTISALSAFIVCPALAGSDSGKTLTPKSSEKFSSADSNLNGTLEQQELEIFAAQFNSDPQSLLGKYDSNRNQVLEEAEFAKLQGKLGESGQNEQAAAGERSQITVTQKPAKITVTKPAPQVTVKQPQPEVTITTQDPKVSVDQDEPQVSVQQARPEVNVAQGDPSVNYEQSEPQVSVDQPEPEVSIQETQPSTGTVASDMTSTSVDPAPAITANSSEEQSVYQMPLQELRTGELMDSSGESYGTIEDVVIKSDGSEAGLLVISEDDTLIYAPVDALGYDNGELVLESEGEVREANDTADFNLSEYVSAPRAAQTLQDAMDKNLSAR